MCWSRRGSWFPIRAGGTDVQGPIPERFDNGTIVVEFSDGSLLIMETNGRLVFSPPTDRADASGKRFPTIGEESCPRSSPARIVAVMAFTAIERAYLQSQSLGRLATVTAKNTPHQVPVGFRLNPDDTIDIGSPNPNAQRYRNVRANPAVSFVVDDMTPDDPKELKPGWGRGVEIRGIAEILTVEDIPVNPKWFTDRVIRIHPRRIHHWHIDPAKPDGETRSVAE